MAAKASTEESSGASPAENAAGENASNPARAIASPRTPPAAASTTDSVSNCLAILHTPAPIALRTAISRARPLARASKRFATLPHAISSTSATAPKSISSAGRVFAVRSSLSGATRIPHPVLVDGCSAASLRESVSSRAAACCWLIPGRSRAINAAGCRTGFVSSSPSSGPGGSHNSAKSGSLNEAGMTPITLKT